MLRSYRLLVVAYDAAMTTTLRQLFEIYPGNPTATMPSGLRVDDAVFARVDSGEAHASDVPGQLAAAVANLRAVIESGGAATSDVRNVTAYVPPSSDLVQVADLWQTLAADLAMAQLEIRTALMPPGQLVALDALAAVNGATITAEAVSLADTVVSGAVRIGPVVYLPALTATDFAEGGLPEGIKAQCTVVFDRLESLMQAAGSSHNQILRITGYMRDLKDKDVLNNEMVARFPVWSEKPVHKYVPAALPPGVEFALQVLAVDGGERRILELEGFKHNDPISLGAQVGNVFVSSRVQARLEADAHAQASRLIESHARRLVEAIGGTTTDIAQMVWGIGDAAFETDVRAACSEHWSAERLPRLDIVQGAFTHSPLPRLEFLALLQAKD